MPFHSKCKTFSMVDHQVLRASQAKIAQTTALIQLEFNVKDDAERQQFCFSDRIVISLYCNEPAFIGIQ